jgi:REP element-mobilizing transposase RayT
MVLSIMKQKSFFKTKDFPKEFGGELLKEKRKTRRPLSTKKPVHTVLRANLKRPISFLKNRNQMNSILQSFAKHFNIRIYKQGLARDHIHFVLKFDSRDDYAGFVRAVSGVLSKSFKFKWLFRPFTRVLEWGRDFKKACKYVFQNELEGLGIIPYQERARRKVVF